MVSFTTIPYDHARRRAARQWGAVVIVSAALIVLLGLLGYGFSVILELLSDPSAS